MGKEREERKTDAERETGRERHDEIEKRGYDTKTDREREKKVKE